MPLPRRHFLGYLITSFYHAKEGKKTASGEGFSASAATCAHRRLPFGTLLGLQSGPYQTQCRVNDRGPFTRGRELDVSPAIARRLHLSGVVKVQVWKLERKER
jgi:rare lipoprotein A